MLRLTAIECLCIYTHSVLSQVTMWQGVTVLSLATMWQYVTVTIVANIQLMQSRGSCQYVNIYGLHICLYFAICDNVTTCHNLVTGDNVTICHCHNCRQYIVISCSMYMYMYILSCHRWQRDKVSLSQLSPIYIVYVYAGSCSMYMYTYILHCHMWQCDKVSLSQLSPIYI